jgi:hypothetical protein
MADVFGEALKIARCVNRLGNLQLLECGEAGDHAARVDGARDARRGEAGRMPDWHDLPVLPEAIRGFDAFTSSGGRGSRNAFGRC